MSDKSSKVSMLKVRGSLPPEYAATLNVLKERIHAGRMRAALAVNREVIDLYWCIGKTLTERQQAEAWGNSVVERLAADLHDAFPDMKGFSPTNIWRMRSFYHAWPSLLPDEPILAQPVPELPEQGQHRPTGDRTVGGHRAQSGRPDRHAHRRAGVMRHAVPSTVLAGSL